MKKKTVYIGIPAHNEERNIGRLLRSILSQKGDNFVIEKIDVVCDGCTDKTAEIVKDFSKQFSVIHCINDSRRVGPAQRMNEFYRYLTSDLFITFDADVVLAHNTVISEIVKKFDDPSIGLVGGNEIPEKQITFVGKSLEAYETYWRTMIGLVAGGNNVHHAPGCISAGRKEVLKRISFPGNVEAHDHFLYFKTLQLGYTFLFARNAVVTFKVPSTFRDFILQSTRYHSSSDYIHSYFGNWVDEHYRIPLSIKLYSYAVTFLKNPVCLLSALFLQFAQRILSKTQKEKPVIGTWQMVNSSK